jgi:hypothetical protein
LGVTEPLPRIAKGERPTFFDDPAVDALVSMLLELARETWVTRAKLVQLQAYVESVAPVGTLPPLSDTAEAALTAEREAFVRRLFRVLDREAEA